MYIYIYICVCVFVCVCACVVCVCIRRISISDYVMDRTNNAKPVQFLIEHVRNMKRQ